MRGAADAPAFNALIKFGNPAIPALIENLADSIAGHSGITGDIALAGAVIFQTNLNPH